MNWKDSTLARSSRVLSRKDKKKVVAVIFLQIFLGALDLIGVATIGILGALAVNGIQSKQPGNRVQTALTYLNLDKETFQYQAAALGIVAAIILIVRTLLSVYFSRKMLFFLSRRGAKISAELISKILAQPLLRIQTRTTQEILYSLTNGVATITLGVLGTTVNLIADVSLLVVMTIGLFVVDPLIAFSTLFIFASIGLLMYALLHKRARALGFNDARLSIASNETIVEVLNSYRESVVRNRRNYYARKIGDLRYELADTLANISFLPNISKYVIETAVVLGTLLISAIQFLLTDASHAVATLAVFLAAGTRIAPAVMRVQQGAIQIRGSLGSAAPTLDLIESLVDVEELALTEDTLDTRHSGFKGELKITNLSFTYPGEKGFSLKNISLAVSAGKHCAIVGTSGAGKTTLVDLLLGIISPQEGNISISGVAPALCVSSWPGAIAYVPQDVIIANGTIRENVALGFPIDVATDDLVWEALRIAHLDEFVKALPEQLDAGVGEKGARISGGQRQRLGIARAMFTSPKLLVLDEATSSLDGETESAITEAIQQLKGSITVIIIAHRLSTVRDADHVLYMDRGAITASGSFEEVRLQVPDFDRQARLMGL